MVSDEIGHLDGGATDPMPARWRRCYRRRSMRLALVLLALTLPGCGGPSNPPGFCGASGVLVRTERDVGECADFAALFIQARGEYEGHWGPLDLKGWTVLIVADRIEQSGEDFDGYTYGDLKLIKIHDPILFLHELHHVQDGFGHVGWCADFVPWERGVSPAAGANDTNHLSCGQ